MNILFPSLPTRIKEIDSSFEAEQQAAIKAGFKTILVDTEPFNKDVRMEYSATPTLYRGWIITPAVYEQLCSLAPMIVDPAAYKFCYYLPNWYKTLGPELTPKSIWFSSNEYDLLHLPGIINKYFKDSPLILKDYIKSAKHDWYDACFIFSANNREEILRVTNNFIDRQGKDLVGGLVYREYIPFKKIGIHPKSKMPLIHEWRFFIYNNKVFYKAPYWSTGDYGDPPPNDCLKPILAKMESPFYSVDMAQKESGEWFNVEVGDGGSSGIPEGGNAEDFYKALADNI
jgi:hypothetical protein